MTKVILVVVLMVVTAVVTVFVVQQLAPPQPQIDVIVEKVRKIAQLATVEYTLSGYSRQLYHSRGIRGPSDYVFSYCTGKITGRVDLGKMTIDVQDKADPPNVSIHFERGSIVVSDVEVKSSETISARSEIGGWFGGKPASNNQRNELARKTREKMKKAAIDSDIVEKTKENAVTFLTDFLDTLGYQAIITFDENAYDPSAST